MYVYITYDRYERNEWFSVSRIETNKARAMKSFVNEDLPDFIGYGPDDCHSFQLQRVWMSGKDHKKLCWLIENEGHLNKEQEEELKEILIAIYDEDDTDDRFYDFETIYSTDGCSDNVELIDFYMANYDYEILDGEDEYDTRDRISNLVYNNEELYNEVLKKYIKANY